MSYIGVDVSKKILDVDWNNQAIQFSNDLAGFNKFINDLRKFCNKNNLTCVILEASGGYEKQFVEVCQKNAIPIHVAHANKIRSFAKSKGILAKTDKLDATVLTAYGKAMEIIEDQILLNEDELKIKQIISRRNQIMNDMMRDKNRLDKITDEDIKISIESHVEWLKTEIARLDQKLKLLSKSDNVKAKHDLLTSVPSIGSLTAHQLIANLPELGKLSHKQISALVGVAPYNRQSGNYDGKRYIQGGRGQLRRALYMSALSSVRWNPDMKLFYTRLKNAGKPIKVIFIAVIRKLLSVLNSIIKRNTPWEQKCL
jgi:transposase